MHKLAVIGDKDSIYGFALLGLDVYPTDNVEDKARLFKKLCSGNYGIIYITEALATELLDEIDKYSDVTVPAIIPIPGVKGNTGMGMNNVKKAVEKAVGSDIIFN